MPRFPVPNAKDMQDLYRMFRWVSVDASEGIFFPVMMFVIWIVSFGTVLADGKTASRAWIFASFFCAVLTILAVLMELMAKEYIYLLVLMVAGGLFWSKLTGRRANL